MKGAILVSGVVSSLVSIIGTVLALHVLAPTIVEAQEARIRAENVVVVDGNGTERVNMSTGPGARSAISVSSVDGAPRVSMNTGGTVLGGGAEPFSGINIFTPEGPGSPDFGVIAYLASGSEGNQPALSLGRPGRAGMRLSADGPTSSRMVMRDANGNVRIVLVVNNDGTPSIRMQDANGNVTWSAP